MIRRIAIVAVLLVLAEDAEAQNAGYPSAAEYAERAEASERAPLFQSHEPLRITLRTDIEWLVEERNDSVEVEGTATFIDLGGSETTRPVDVRARGEFRRDRRNCNFPPLRLNFPRGQMDGTVFGGEDRLKLVTPCHDNRDDYQRFVHDEYLAYRVLNLLTPYSFRVRLVEITYEDIEGDYDTRTKIGFLIESDERMAERKRAAYVGVAQLPPRAADGAQSVLVDVFSYMIGNVDWSAAEFHNAVLIRTEDGRYLAVPYDFDFSGVVDARYAAIPPQLASQIRSVRQRVYRGFCRPELQYEAVATLFGSRREAVEELYRSFGLYRDPGHAEDALEYYEEFWEVIDDAREFEDEILDECRELP